MKGCIQTALHGMWTVTGTQMATRKLLGPVLDQPRSSCDSNMSMYKRQPEYGPKISPEPGLESICIYLWC